MIPFKPKKRLDTTVVRDKDRPTYRVQIAGQERRLKSSRCRVEDDSPWNQEGCKLVRHSSQGLNRSSSSQQQHGRHDNVRCEAKEKESQMGRSTPAGVDDFRDGVGGRSDFLEVDGQDSKEKDLDGGTRRVPA
jgi:hypothetical protein